MPSDCPETISISLLYKHLDAYDRSAGQTIGLSGHEYRRHWKGRPFAFDLWDSCNRQAPSRKGCSRARAHTRDGTERATTDAGPTGRGSPGLNTRGKPSAWKEGRSASPASRGTGRRRPVQADPAFSETSTVTPASSSSLMGCHTWKTGYRWRNRRTAVIRRPAKKSAVPNSCQPSGRSVVPM